MAVGEARGVPHEILDQDRTLRRHQIERRCTPGGTHLLDADLHVLELGEVFCDRLVERDLALLVEHHGRDLGDRLGHRIDAKNCIADHWRFGFWIEGADSLEIPELSMSCDEQYESRRLSCCCILPKNVGDAVEPLG